MCFLLRQATISRRSVTIWGGKGEKRWWCREVDVLKRPDGTREGFQRDNNTLSAAAAAIKRKQSECQQTVLFIRRFLPLGFLSGGAKRKETRSGGARLVEIDSLPKPIVSSIGRLLSPIYIDGSNYSRSRLTKELVASDSLAA